MRDNLSLSCTPTEEPCAQVGSDNYQKSSERECRAFIDQLKRKFGEPPGSARFRVTVNPHDFGHYHDVVIEYDESSDKELNYALKVEGNLPENWDDEAKRIVHGKSVLSLLVNAEIGKAFETVRDAGYTRVDLVTQPGQFASRGGIFDVFSYGHTQPVRVELFGDTIESIRTFDETNQTTKDSLDKVDVYVLEY